MCFGQNPWEKSPVGQANNAQSHAKKKSHGNRWGRVKSSDLALASKYPLLHHLLQIPIDLELFDGELTSGGRITHDLMTPILYGNGVQHMVTFHKTKLHRSNPIVLGLKWLRDINPNVDWASLSLVFQKERLAGATVMDNQSPQIGYLGGKLMDL